MKPREQGSAVIGRRGLALAGLAGASLAILGTALALGRHGPRPSGPDPVIGQVLIMQRTADGQDRRIIVHLWQPAPPQPAGPLLLSFPGWDGDWRDGAGLARDLASHGYAVAQIDPGAPAAAMDFSSDAAAIRTGALADHLLAAQAVDARLVLEQLAGFAARPVAALGFSFGGAVAAELSRLSPRIRAVVNLDGWLFGQAAARGVPAPYLLVSDDEPLPSDADLASLDPAHRASARLDRQDSENLLAHQRDADFRLLTIAGTRHLNFSDAAMGGWLRRGGGAIDPARATAITRCYVRAFFDRHLRGAPASLLDHPSPFAEARLERAASAGGLEAVVAQPPAARARSDRADITR
jgi:dienelactone hydrolase